LIATLAVVLSDSLGVISPEQWHRDNFIGPGSRYRACLDAIAPQIKDNARIMDIRSKVISAVRWTAAARLLGQIISWVITITVIRLLTPVDYGLMAMATVIVSFLFLLNTLGLDAVLIQEKDLQDDTRRKIFGFVLVVNWVFFGLMFSTADTAAAFYGSPELAPMLQVLSLQFLILGFETLPLSQLEREIEFARRSIVDFLTLVMSSMAILTMALMDFGVWSLVWGMLVNTVLRVIGLNIITRGQLLPSFNFSGLGKHLSFGTFVTTDRSLWYLFSESDKFIGGKVLGSQLLGYYAVASHLASLPIQKISGLLNSIAFPAFSQAHAATSQKQVQNYLLTATHVMSIAAFPVFLGMAATAGPIIAVLLGEAWLPAAPLLCLLGLVMPFRLLSNVFPPLLWGIGKPAVSASNFLFAAIAMPLAFYFGTRWGVEGLAYAWLLMYPVVFIVTGFRACRAVELSLLAFLHALMRPLLAGAVMFAAVWTLQSDANLLSVTVIDLLIWIGVGIGVYGVMMLAIDREGLKELLGLIRHK